MKTTFLRRALSFYTRAIRNPRPCTALKIDFMRYLCVLNESAMNRSSITLYRRSADRSI